MCYWIINGLQQKSVVPQDSDYKQINNVVNDLDVNSNAPNGTYTISMGMKCLVHIMRLAHQVGQQLNVKMVLIVLVSQDVGPVLIMEGWLNGYK